MCQSAPTEQQPSTPPPPQTPAPSIAGDDGGDIHTPLLKKRRRVMPASLEEAGNILSLALPMALSGLLLYPRSMISMVFLGHLGRLPLAGGSLAIGFANITGYSVLSGLAMGMEPICVQAFGARQPGLLILTLRRTVLLLLSCSIPISLLWLSMFRLLLGRLHLDAHVAASAGRFISFAVPDLVLLSFLHPIRVYLRSQGVTLPITFSSLASVLLHAPINYLLVVRLRMGISGVAIATVVTDLNLFLCLLAYLLLSSSFDSDCDGDSVIMAPSPSSDCLRGWSALLRLAVPTCASVCLEWWWYELMIVLSGLLPNHMATLSSMGILIQTTSLVYVFPSSLGLAASTRIGNELGALRPARARTASFVSLALAALLGLAAMAFTASVRHLWGSLFTDDAEILRLTAAALPIVGLCELGNCPQTAGCGVLRGSARPATGANINLGSFYLVGMPVAVFLGFAAGMGFTGLWLGLLAAQASCAVLMSLALLRTDWSAEAERARELTKPPAAAAANDGGDISEEDLVIKIVDDVDHRGGITAEEEEEDEEAAMVNRVCSERDPLVIISRV